MPTLAPEQSRAAGEHVSNEVAAPARGQSQATKFRITLSLPTTDLNDPTLFIDTTLEGTIDGVNYTLFAKATGWQGGTVSRDGTVRPPALGWAASDNRVLTRVRVRWTQSKTASVGVNMDFDALTVS